MATTTVMVEPETGEPRKLVFGDHNFEGRMNPKDFELQVYCSECGTFSVVKIWPGIADRSLPQEMSEFVAKTTNPVCAEQKVLNETRFVQES